MFGGSDALRRADRRPRSDAQGARRVHRRDRRSRRTRSCRACKPFATWDETVAYTKQNAADRTVLMERAGRQGREPWTWVRTQGKGRVFYTAYGHDQRTWSNPEFQTLVEKAIVWAVDEPARRAYPAAEDAGRRPTSTASIVPNYENRDPAPKYQLPFTPTTR